MMKKVERPSVFGRLYTTLFDLNVEEQKLLKSFNKVPKDQQQKVLQIVKIFEKTNTESRQNDKLYEEYLRWKFRHEEKWLKALDDTKSLFNELYGAEDET